MQYLFLGNGYKIEKEYFTILSKGESVTAALSKEPGARYVTADLNI